MKTNEAKELGAKLGAEAFAAGIKSAPALDRKVREAIGTMPGDTAAVIALLDGWNAAWHAANLAAPVDAGDETCKHCNALYSEHNCP